MRRPTSLRRETARGAGGRVWPRTSFWPLQPVEGLARLGSGRSTLALIPGTHVVPGLKFTAGTSTLVGLDDAGVRLCHAAARLRIASTTPTGLEVSGGSITVEQPIIAADAGTPDGQGEQSAKPGRRARGFRRRGRPRGRCREGRGGVSECETAPVRRGAHRPRDCQRRERVSVSQPAGGRVGRRRLRAVAPRRPGSWPPAVAIARRPSPAGAPAA